MMLRLAIALSLGLGLLSGCALLPATKTVEGIEGPARSIKIKSYVRTNEPLNGLAEGFDGRSLRMRYWDINPGGVVPIHSHRGRPATIYVVNGEVLEFRNGNDDAPLEHKGGEISVESEGLIHHWLNETDETVNLVATDIWASGAKGAIAMPENIKTLTGTSSGAEFETMAEVVLDGEAIGVTGYTLRTQRITLATGGTTGVVTFANGPGNVFVLEGAVNAQSSETDTTTPMEISSSEALVMGTSTIWTAVDGPAVLIVSDIIASGA